MLSGASYEYYIHEKKGLPSRLDRPSQPAPAQLGIVAFSLATLPGIFKKLLDFQYHSSPVFGDKPLKTPKCFVPRTVLQSQGGKGPTVLTLPDITTAV